MGVRGRSPLHAWCHCPAGFADAKGAWPVPAAPPSAYRPSVTRSPSPRRCFWQSRSASRPPRRSQTSRWAAAGLALHVAALSGTNAGSAVDTDGERVVRDGLFAAAADGAERILADEFALHEVDHAVRVKGVLGLPLQSDGAVAVEFDLDGCRLARGLTLCGGVVCGEICQYVHARIGEHRSHHRGAASTSVACVVPRAPTDGFPAPYAVTGAGWLLYNRIGN